MICLLTLPALILFADGIPTRPLPDAGQLRQKTLANMRDGAAALERYSCDIEMRSQQLDDQGRVKKVDSHEAERFFVNGVRINHTLARNGKTLKGNEAAKEQERTDKEVRKYSDAAEAKKFEDQREKQLDMFLRAQRLMNGKREDRGGRSTLVYDLVADTSFHPKTIEERFAQAVGGRVWIDEESGAAVELKVQTTRDVKIGGGLLANVHKGFELHVVRTRQRDGLWLTNLVEGNADLRAGLFFHPRIRFSEQTRSCHLFSVDARDLQHDSAERSRAGKMPD